MRLVIMMVVALFMVSFSPEAWAIGFGHTMKVQTRVVERAISRNLDKVFRPKLTIAKGATGPVTALALSADERYLVTAVGNNSVRVWDLSVGREVARLSGHTGRVTDIAIADDGSYAVTVGEDKSIRSWDLKDFGRVALLGNHADKVTGVALAGQVKQVFSASADGKVRIAKARTGEILREFQAHEPGLVRIAVTPDGKSLVTAGEDERVKIWNGQSGALLQNLDADGAALDVDISLDQKLVAVGTNDGDALVWRLDGASIAKIGSSADEVLSVAFTPDGRSLMLGGSNGKVMEASLANERVERTFGKHDDRVSFVAVSSDGAFALSGSEDGLSRLWNMASGKLLLSLISTEGGWAVIDAKGRYDGNQEALSGIEWQDSDDIANIEDFAETHYQAALLPRIVEGADVADANTIPEGVKYPPKVRFISPEDDDSAASGTVQVEVIAEDEGGGVAELRLYRNGKLVPSTAATIQRENTKKAGDTVTARYRVALLPGSNVLSATALNKDRFESRPQSISLGSGMRPEGKLHLMTVGINRYAQSKLNLDYARPDARSINKFLAAAKKAAIPVASVVSLEDKQATRANILAALRKLRAVPPEDVVVIYMAGHGVSVGDDWYYISHEVKIPKRPSQLAGQGLSSEEIKAEMEAMGADRTLLLLDTCHSGTAVSPLKDYTGLKSLRLLARTVGAHVLAATDRNQYAVELEALGHGIFTYTVLAALHGEGDESKDGAVSASELIRFVEDKVPLLSRKFADYPQYPTGYSRGSDFVVAEPN